MLLEINAVMQLTCGEHDRNSVQADLRDSGQGAATFCGGPSYGILWRQWSFCSVFTTWLN